MIRRTILIAGVSNRACAIRWKTFGCGAICGTDFRTASFWQTEITSTIAEESTISHLSISVARNFSSRWPSR
jgi:hypothetical protein